MANRRRGRGEGSYRLLPTGKWLYKLRKGGKAVTATGATKAEAKANLFAKAARPVQGAPFGSLARTYLLSKTEWSQTTKDNFSTWLSSKVDGSPVASMTGVDDSMVAEWLQGYGGSASSRRNGFAHLKAVLAFAGLSTTVKPPKRARPRRRPLTPAESATLAGLARAAGPSVELAFLLAVECGMRRGEICGLAFEDVHEGGVWVRRSVVRTSEGLRVKSTKNEKWRWVPLSDALLERLGSGKGFVLGRGREPLNPSTLASWFYGLKQGSGLDVPFLGLHALRRTYGMTLLEHGTDVKTAAELMGHDEAMLLKVYSGSRRDLKREAVKRAFGRPLGATEGADDKPKGA